MSAGQLLSASTAQAAVSGSTLILIDKFYEGALLTSDELMRGLVQGGASWAQNIIAPLIAPVLPQSLVSTERLFKPLVVGGTFMLAEMLLTDTGKTDWKYNLAASTIAQGASEMIYPAIANIAGLPVVTVHAVM